MSTFATQSDLNNLAEIVSGLATAVQALVDSNAPASTKSKARKAAPKAKATPKAQVKTLALCKKTRARFIAAAAKEGVTFPAENGVNWSTKEIAQYCVAEGYAPKGFRIGEGYAALYS